MDCAKLDKLPFETIQQIAGYLHDTHRPSLYTFGLASKTCHRATLQSVFREVHLRVRNRKALQHDIDALVKVLSGAESTHYVRHLSIKGFLPLNIDEFDDPGNVHDSIRYFQQRGVAEVLGDEEPYLGGVFFVDEAIEVSPEEDVAWTPLVHFVKTLPHLTKLVYDCSNQFPPSLLDALHKYHPHCKLYHLTFRLRSLRSETIDPHEMAIATSPCLYSIKTRHVDRDSIGKDDFHRDAIPEIIASLAPNLKEVRMIELCPYITDNSIRKLNIPREPWRSLPGFIPGRGIGLLTSLSLAGWTYFKPDLLQTWNQCIDFSSLNYLALGGGVYDYSSIGINSEVLEWITQNCSFPRLKTLRIRLDRDDSDNIKPNYINNAITFFKALEPLYKLSVDGSLESEILDSILSRHGYTLRKLSLRPFESPFSIDRQLIPMIFGKEHVLQIQIQCPALQDLAISVKRTKSDKHETEIYRSFSKMECLEVLFLTLDCSNWKATRGSTSTNDPSFDEDNHLFDEDDPSFDGDNPSFDEDDRKLYVYHEPLRRGHVRETLINCAVDEMLARSIWKTICQDKAGKRLKSLKLYTTGGGDFGNATGYDLYNVIDNLSRSWLIEKSIRDDKDIINVRELGRGAREARDKEESAICDRYREGDRTGSAYPDHSAVHIFRRIWGSKEGSKDWRQDWASFPLHG